MSRARRRHQSRCKAQRIRRIITRLYGFEMTPRELGVFVSTGGRPTKATTGDTYRPVRAWQHRADISYTEQLEELGLA